MRLTYSHAIVSFCPDLTTSAAPQLPVGVLVIGRLEGGGGIAAILVPSIRAPQPDEIINEVLRSVPQLLQEHVDEALSEDPGREPVEILRSLHEKLRNSLYVSKIVEDEQLSYDGRPREKLLYTAMPELYEKALSDAGWQLGDANAGEQLEQSTAPATPSVSLGDVPLAEALYGLDKMIGDPAGHHVGA